MRALFANYAQIMRTFCQLCATILKIMCALFANYAHLPRKVVNNDVSSELPTISK